MKLRFLDKLMTQEITLQKNTQTEADEVFGTVTEDTTDYKIKCLIITTAPEDLRFLPPGVIETGDIRVLVRNEYIMDDGTKIEPDEEDFVVYNGRTYRIYQEDPVMATRYTSDRFKVLYGRRQSV